MHVAGAGDPHPTDQGFVVEWQGDGYRWFARVMTVAVDTDARPETEVRWVEVERLTPIRSNPDNARRVRHLGQRAKD